MAWIKRRQAGFIAMTILAALPAVAWGQGAEDVERTIHRQTTAGQPVRIRAYTRYNRRCQQDGSPQFTMLQSPAHGALEQRSELVEIKGQPLPGATLCTGKTVSGIAMWYTPQAAFVGTERFEYRVTYGSLARQDTVIVEVR